MCNKIRHANGADLIKLALAAWLVSTFSVPASGSKRDADTSYLEQPLPAEGHSGMMTFSQSTNVPGMYEVALTGQEQAPVFISGETLRLIVNSPVPDGVKAAAVSQYPHQMINMYDHTLNTYYPDDAASYVNNPFPGWESAAERVTIAQDPYAPNYVRVRVVDEDGRVEEFSVSRHSVDEVLNATIPEGSLAAALAEYPYRLPENARYSFNHLTREQLVAMIEETPGMARQEFVQVKRVYLNPKPDTPTPPVTEPIIPDADSVQEPPGDVVIPPLAPPKVPVAARAQPSEPQVIDAGVDAVNEEPPPGEAGAGRVIALAMIGLVGLAALIMYRRQKT